MKNKNGYLVHNVDGSMVWAHIDKGEASEKFVDRWALCEKRPRANVCEWCSKNSINITFEDTIFSTPGN